MKILVSLALGAYLGLGSGGCGNAPLADEAAQGGEVAAKPATVTSQASSSAEFAA